MTEQITRTIIVKADAEKAYEVWKNFENFPYFMKHIKSVTKKDDRVSYWKLDGPLGKQVEWEAELTRLDPNKRIAWSTKDRQEGNLTTSGQVTFNNLPQGETEVTVLMQYEPHVGVIGDLIAKIFAKPDEKLEEDLQNFKGYVEGMYRRTE